MSIWDELQKHVSETYDTLSGGLLRNHKEGLLNLSPQQRTAVNKWREQDFGKDDSLIASTIRNPIGAVEELAGYIDKNVKLASGLTPYNPLDPYADARGALELAGMAELGSIPFAPKSAGGTLGTVAGYGTAKNIAKKLDKKYPDVDASISGNGEHFTLDKLIIDKANRKQGIGGHFMDDLTGYADDTAKQLRLTADGDFGGSKAGQKRFYKRHGFIENKGRNRDYEFKENMYREPDSQVIGDNDAFKIAQRNATLPVKDGGLGLPANNTAMDRAKSLGFDTNKDWYHGTTENFDAFKKPEYFNTPTFLAPSEHLANQFAGDVGFDAYGTWNSPQVIKTINKASNTFDVANKTQMDELIETMGHRDLGDKIKGVKEGQFNMVEDESTMQVLKDLGYDSFNIREVPELAAFKQAEFTGKKFNDRHEARKFYDEQLNKWRYLGAGDSAKPKALRSGDIFEVRYKGEMFNDIDRALHSKNKAIFDPKNIRSKFAAFDPFKRESANLLATGLLGSTVLGGLLNEQRQQQTTY